MRGPDGWRGVSVGTAHGPRRALACQHIRRRRQTRTPVMLAGLAAVGERMLPDTGGRGHYQWLGRCVAVRRDPSRVFPVGTNHVWCWRTRVQLIRALRRSVRLSGRKAAGLRTAAQELSRKPKPRRAASTTVSPRCPSASKAPLQLSTSSDSPNPDETQASRRVGLVPSHQHPTVKPQATLPSVLKRPGDPVRRDSR